MTAPRASGKKSAAKKSMRSSSILAPTRPRSQNTIFFAMDFLEKYGCSILSCSHSHFFFFFFSPLSFSFFFFFFFFFSPLSFSFFSSFFVQNLGLGT
jgi:hypothetical protein